jgi:hypothetical protein
MAYQVPVLSDFRTLFPEFPDTVFTDDQVNMWLTQADPFFDKCRWDDLLFLGMLYWTAHQLVVNKQNSLSQNFDDAITKKVGDIMKTRSEKLMLQQMNDPYQRTLYGQQYQSYVCLVGIGGYTL